MTDGQPMRVGIAGAGPVAYGTAALLDSRGHGAALWSPVTGRTKALAEGAPLVTTGALEHSFSPGVADSAEALVAGCDVVMICLPGFGHRRVIDAIAPHIRPGQPVIVSSQSSFGPLYLADLLARRGITAPVAAWSTTTVTGRQPDPTSCIVVSVRARIDMCAVPVAAGPEMQALCERLFGERFLLCDGLLAVTLSNLNPQAHLGIALCNFTRMENGEVWSQNLNVTPGVGRLLEALDDERLAIAQALGLHPRSIFDHLHLSYHVPMADTVSGMFAAMQPMGMGHNGPPTADSRYVTEDAPFGLWPTVLLGRITGREAVLHAAGVAMFSAIYGRDFAAENDLLPALGLERLSLKALVAACETGRLPG